MSNKHRGVIEFEALDRKFLLKLDTDAFCTLEGRTGLSTPQMIMEIRSGKLRLIHAMLLAAMEKRNPNVDGDLVSEVIDDLTLPGTIDVLDRALSVSLFVAKGSASPPKPEPTSQETETPPG